MPMKAVSHADESSLVKENTRSVHSEAEKNP